MTDKKLIGYSTDEGFNIVLYYSDGTKHNELDKRRDIYDKRDGTPIY